MRLEYSILLERLEERALLIPDGTKDFEEMSPPPSPRILSGSLTSIDSKLSRNGLAKKGGKKVKGSANTSGAPNNRLQRIRDPDLPKRPTNAYLIFCEMERERIKNEIDDTSGTPDLSKSLTEAWKNLDDEKRKPYYKLYEDDRDRYQREMTLYNQRKQLEDDTKNESSPKRQKIDDSEPGVENSKDTKSELEEDENVNLTSEINEPSELNEPKDDYKNSPIPESANGNNTATLGDLQGEAKLEE